MSSDTKAIGTRGALWPAAFLIPALALAALVWVPPAARSLGLPPMMHPSYVRQVLLAILAAPALAVGLLALGPDRAAVRAALNGGPARLFLVAVWGQAVLGWASLGWTSNAGATLSRAMELSALALWGTGWLLAASASGRLRARLLAGHFAVGALIAFTGCAAYLIWLAQGVPPARLGSPISNPNTVAVLMIFPVAAACAFVVRGARPGGGVEGGRWKVEGGSHESPPSSSSTLHLPPSTFNRLPAFLAVVLILALTAFVLAWSRSGFAGLAAAGLFLLGSLLRPRWRLAGVAVLGVAAVGVAAWMTGDPARLLWLEEKLKLGSLASRYYGTIAGWGILSDHPVLGAGAGTFLSEAPAHIPPEHYLASYGEAFLNLAHNEYAQVAAEGGLVGLGLFLSLLAAVIWGGLKVEGGRWKVEGGGSGDTKTSSSSSPLAPQPSTLHLPPSTLHQFPAAPLSLGLAAATAGVAVSSLADPSFRFWDFTVFFYAAAGAVAARALPETEPATRPKGRLPLRIGILAGALALAVLAAAFWAVPDARREAALLEAHDLSARGEHARGAERYAFATLTPGNFLYRIQAANGWVTSLGRSGRSREALERAEWLCRTMPDCPQTLRLLAVARFANGDRAGALGALVQAGRLDPYDREFRRRFFQLLGAAPGGGGGTLAALTAGRFGLPAGDRAALESLELAAGGNWSGALSAVRDLTPADASFLQLELWRGICLAESDRPAEALAAFDRQVRAAPLDAQGWYWRARAVVEALGRPGDEQAMASLRRCVQLDVEDDDARIALSDLLLRNDRPGEVPPLLAPRMAVSRRAAELAMRLAEAYRQLGRMDESRAALEAALLLTGDARLRSALEKLAEIEHKPQMNTDGHR